MAAARARFEQTLAAAAPPAGLTHALEALWWDAKGDWERAHKRATAFDDVDCAWVHAYLHRKEGDPDNAAYWYRCAGRPRHKGSLQAEWNEIVAELLGRQSAG